MIQIQNQFSPSFSSATHPRFAKQFLHALAFFCITAIVGLPAGTTLAEVKIPEALTNDRPRDFNLKDEVTGRAKTLQVWAEQYNPSAKTVLVSGVDWSGPGLPYTFDWGDGNQTTGQWPQGHAYRANSNYVITVTSHHPRLGPATNLLAVRFTPSAVRKMPLPNELWVKILDRSVMIKVPDSVPKKLDFFGPAFFQCLPRQDIEYVLHAAACIQYDLCNGDVFLPEGLTFHQVISRNAKLGGMSSHWDSTPASFEVGDYGFKPPIQYSSFFHEMGHNFNLNSPADFRYGSRANGCASSIYTETLAQITQYATACSLINHRDVLGLDPFTVLEIKVSAIDHVRILRRHHEKWVAKGMKFQSWDDSVQKKEAVVGTFMTLAYRFVERAELAGKGNRLPVKRMMRLLQCFNSDWQARWSQKRNSPAAETFRATLMVAAISYGLEQDLRKDFKAMQYPINDMLYAELLQAAGEGTSTKKPSRPES